MRKRRVAHPVRTDSAQLSGDGLFGESGARAIVSVSPAKLAALRATARQYGVGAHEIGKVTRDNSLRIEYKGHTVVQSDVPALRDVWADSLERAIRQ